MLNGCLVHHQKSSMARSQKHPHRPRTFTRRATSRSNAKRLFTWPPFALRFTSHRTVPRQPYSNALSLHLPLVAAYMSQSTDSRSELALLSMKFLHLVRQTHARSNDAVTIELVLQIRKLILFWENASSYTVGSLTQWLEIDVVGSKSQGQYRSCGSGETRNSDSMLHLTVS
ncbi:hypothetical protein BKA63DRAFT_11165 [Paraphoma chrysanthemicola]|nr:hypothetical protein BKA63DRAFT_11165 [Paraphoma chrysanthemicola]